MNPILDTERRVALDTANRVIDIHKKVCGETDAELARLRAQVCELRTELKDAAAMASGLRAHYERSKGNYAAAASFQMRVDLWEKLLAKTSADYSGLIAVRREEWEAAKRKADILDWLHTGSFKHI